MSASISNSSKGTCQGEHDVKSSLVISSITVALLAIFAGALAMFFIGAFALGDPAYAADLSLSTGDALTLLLTGVSLIIAMKIIGFVGKQLQRFSQTN